MNFLNNTVFGYKMVLVFLLTFVHLLDAKAQCNTNAPAISLKTFGAGTPAYSVANPGSFGFHTTYIQEYGGVGAETNDGEFSFINSVGNYWGTWHGGATDHTGDPGGYMMLVNASYEPGKFYNDTISGLCTGVEYEFSAWIASVQSSAIANPDLLVPNVKFEIRNPVNGNLLADLETGDIASTPTMVWRRYSISFIATSDRVELFLINNNSGGNGNDLVLDDIAFKPCLPDHKVNGVKELCEGEDLSLSLDAIVTNFVDPQYKWQKRNGAGTWQDVVGAITKTIAINSVIPTDSGWYRAIASGVGNINSLNCRVMDSIHVTIHPTLVPGVIAADQVVCGAKNPIAFTETIAATKGKGTITYQWQYSDDNSVWNNITGATNTTYSSPIISADRWFRRQDKDNGCGTEYGNVVKLTYENILSPITSDTTYCAHNASYTQSAIGFNLKWYVTKQGVGTTVAPVNDASIVSTSKYYVTQTVGSCESPFDSIQVDVFQKPVITLSSVEICEGEDTLLTPSITNTSGTIDYLWSTAGALANNTDATLRVIPIISTDYNLLIADADGCLADTTIMVKVNPKPTITSADVEFCSGLNTTINASGADSYVWSPANGLSGTTGASVVANPLTNTTYSVEGIDVKGCKNTTTVNVSVSPKPVLNDVAGAYCEGLSTTFNLTPNNATGVVSYVWSPTNGLSTSKGSNVVVKSATSTNYTIELTDTKGCKDTAVASVTVHPKPVITSNDVVFCEGLEVQITTSTTNATGAVSYVWIPAIGSNNSSATVNLSTTANYSTIVTDAEGCTDTVVTKVSVNPKPDLSIQGGDVCNGVPQQLSATVLNHSGGLSYYWSPNTALSATTLATVNATPAVTTVYTLEVTDAMGCKDTSKTTVGVTALPLAKIFQGDTVLCQGEIIVLDAYNDVSQSYAVEWLYGKTATNLEPYNSGFTTTIKNEGYYAIKVTNYGFCPQYTTPVFVDIETLDIKANAIYREVYYDESINLYATGSSEIKQYVWMSPLQPVYSQKEVELINAESAWFNVEGTGEKCIVNDDIFINVLPPIIIPNGFSPNGDDLNERWFIDGLSTFKNCNVTVYNRWGNVVFESEGYDDPWEGKNKAGDFLPVATYYYVIEVNDRREQEFKGSVTILK